ncbi:MAG: hypothetical protein ACI9Y1_002872 [Lentisphaeria bacterium]|jgi:hypothetical protein
MSSVPIGSHAESYGLRTFQKVPYSIKLDFGLIGRPKMEKQQNKTKQNKTKQNK